MNWKYVLAIVLALVSVSAFAVLSSTDGSDAGTGTSGVTYDLNKGTGVLTIIEILGPSCYISLNPQGVGVNTR